MNNEKMTSVINSDLLLNPIIKQFGSQLALTVIFTTTINRLIVVLPSRLMYHRSLTPATVLHLLGCIIAGISVIDNLFLVHLSESI